MTRAVSRAVRGTKPQTKARMLSLVGVRWVLASEHGRFVAVDDRAQATLVRDPSLAMIHGRDNEAPKTRFFEALLKIPLTVVLIGL